MIYDFLVKLWALEAEEGKLEGLYYQIFMELWRTKNLIKYFCFLQYSFQLCSDNKTLVLPALLVRQCLTIKIPHLFFLCFKKYVSW